MYYNDSFNIYIILIIDPGTPFSLCSDVSFAPVHDTLVDGFRAVSFVWSVVSPSVGQEDLVAFLATVNTLDISIPKNKMTENTSY